MENGFSEQDELWNPNVRETDPQRAVRAKTFLDDIFNNDNSTFVSLTTHSGMIQSLLEVTGHRKWQVSPGGLLPVFVRAEWFGNGALGSGGISIAPRDVEADWLPVTGPVEPRDPNSKMNGGNGDRMALNTEHFSDRPLTIPEAKE